MKLSKEFMRRWNKTLRDLSDERRRLEAQYQHALEALERQELARQQQVYAVQPKERHFGLGDRVFVDYSGTENGISREGTVIEVEVTVPTIDDDYYNPDWCAFDEDDSTSCKEASVWVTVNMDPTPKGTKSIRRFCVAGASVEWSAPLKKIS